MCLLDLNQYNNLLDEISMTSTHIRNNILLYKLSFLQVRNSTVEWGMRIPMFVPSFYDFIIKQHRIPNQEEAYNYYLSYNKEYFESNHLSGEIMTGIKARCFRTYPSLVRDVYFNKFVSEKLPV